MRTYTKDDILIDLDDILSLTYSKEGSFLVEIKDIGCREVQAPLFCKDRVSLKVLREQEIFVIEDDMAKIFKKFFVLLGSDFSQLVQRVYSILPDEELHIGIAGNAVTLTGIMDEVTGERVLKYKPLNDSVKYLFTTGEGSYFYRYIEDSYKVSELVLFRNISPCE